MIEPGSIDTPIWERGEENADEIARRAAADAKLLYGGAIERYRQVVRDTAERGHPAGEGGGGDRARARVARRPRTRYLVGLDAQVQARLKPLLPTRALRPHVARALSLRAARRRIRSAPYTEEPD